MKRLICITAAFLFLAAGTDAFAQNVEFNYNGLVRVQGEPYDGEGFFKFSIVNRQATTTYWANDGVTLDGSQPTESVAIDVDAGFFSVNIGDAETTGMAALDPSVFNTDDRVLLRVWFSDGVHGFERLNPDRRISNPALLGIQSVDAIDLYADPVTGDDENAGTRSQRPKKTIQAAWNELPALLRNNVTIHLANGTYRETVFLNTKTVIGDHRITIVGDADTPSNVRITGSNPAADQTPVLDDGFVVQAQKRLVIEGLLFNHFKRSGIDLEDEAQAEIRDCKFDNIRFGILTNRSTLLADSCEIGNGYEAEGVSVGIHMNRFSAGTLKNCYLHHLYIGATAQQVSLFETIEGTTSSSNAVGFQITQCSNMTFAAPNSTISNNGIGIVGGQNSSITYSETYVNFSGNTTKYDLRTGTQIWPPAP
jgi:hypothetical protein